MALTAGVDAATAVQVFFLSDSTGISAETMGNALLLQFPGLMLERELIPFISSVDEADRVVERLDAAAHAGPAVAFCTAANDEVRQALLRTVCPIVDFFEQHIRALESVFHTPGARQAQRLHGIGDAQRYNARMAAVEFAIEHDDGESSQRYNKADVILIAPSRCGKTPTTMYLALQHGLFVANYPLVPEDLTGLDLPAPLRDHRDRCFGILTTADRLSQVRAERRPDSTYASLDQCTWELRRAEKLLKAHRIPSVDASTRSVEEMSTVVLQTLHRR